MLSISRNYLSNPQVYLMEERLVNEKGVLWILKNGATYKDLPGRYPHPSTCRRRVRQWSEDGVLKDMRRAFLSELDRGGMLDRDRVILHASFYPVKKALNWRGLRFGLPLTRLIMRSILSTYDELHVRAMSREITFVWLFRYDECKGMAMFTL